MLWSEAAIVTIREENHPLLVRAAFMRGREHLLLGLRTLAKIGAILREETDRGVALERCGVKAIRAAEHSDVFVAEAEDGDEVLVRGAGNYAALLGRAAGVAEQPVFPDSASDLAREELHTPDIKTIAQLTAFTGLPATSQIKSLVMVSDGRPLLVLLRGDHQLSVAKLPGARRAEPAEIREWFGADPGSIGPVGVKGIRILADAALRGRRNMISGANKTGYHLRNVTPGEDFAAEFADLRQVVAGDASLADGSPLQFSKVVLLDTVENILKSAVEQNHDAEGMMLPAAIAPFAVIVTPVHPERLKAAREIYERLLAEGHDALLDDREARPGVKFKDADLIGIPYRINVGKKLAEGTVVLIERRSRQSTDVPARAINIPR